MQNCARYENLAGNGGVLQVVEVQVEQLEVKNKTPDEIIIRILLFNITAECKLHKTMNDIKIKLRMAGFASGGGGSRAEFQIKNEATYEIIFRSSIFSGSPPNANIF